MIRFAALIAVMALTACATPWETGTDFVGNVYPEECRRDLSYVETPVSAVSEAFLLRIKKVPKGTELYELHVTRTGGSTHIYIRDDLHGWIKEEAIHHGRCHAIGWRHK